MENKLDENKKIYVIFLSTPTKMGKFIRSVTKYKYNHVALALNKDLANMYSFARYNYKAPLVGGFVVESSLRYKNKKVDIKICELEISISKYNNIVADINKLINSKDEYMYNILSAILIPFKKNLCIQNTDTCINFIKNILVKYDIVDGLTNNTFCTIENLDNWLKEYVIYEGEMRKVASFDSWGEDKYNKQINIFTVFLKTVAHIFKLIKRACISDLKK